MRGCLFVSTLASAAFAAACTSGDPAAPATQTPENATHTYVDARGRGLPVDVAELFQTRIMPTCSRNAGVCHNSSTYPDLRHLAALEELVMLPCGREVDSAYPDACEPPGDRIVAPGVDVRIDRAVFDPTTSTATLTVDGDVPPGPIVDATIARMLPTGAAFSPFETTELDIHSLGGRTLTAEVVTSDRSARAFFDVALPLREDRLARRRERQRRRGSAARLARDLPRATRQELRRRAPLGHGAEPGAHAAAMSRVERHGDLGARVLDRGPPHGRERQGPELLRRDRLHRLHVRGPARGALRPGLVTVHPARRRRYQSRAPEATSEPKTNAPKTWKQL